MMETTYQDLVLRQFDASSPDFGAWAGAVEMGFHGPEPSARRRDLLTRISAADRVTATALYDPPAAAGNADLPVATFGSFPAQANLGREAVPVAMFTAATVRPAYKRRGILRRMLELNLGQAKEGGVPLVLLTASSAAIYGRFGFQSVVPTAHVSVDPARFQLLPGAAQSASAYSVDWVLRDRLFDLPPAVSRAAHLLHRGSTPRHHMFAVEHFVDPATDEYDAKYRGLVCRDAEGAAVGYAVYSATGFDGDLHVQDLDATDPAAELALWQQLAATEGIGKIHFRNFALSSPLRVSLVDERALQVTHYGDHLWARVLDPATCFRARSYTWAAHVAGLSATFAVTDPLGLAAGRFRIALSAIGVQVSRLDSSAAAGAVDATVSANALADLLYSASSVENLRVAGLISDLDAADLPRWEALFAPASPATFRNYF